MLMLDAAEQRMV